MNRNNFINRLKVKKDNNQTNIISETENDVTISCCNGRSIRCLNKDKKKPAVSIDILQGLSGKIEEDPEK